MLTLDQIDQLQRDLTRLHLMGQIGDGDYIRQTNALTDLYIEVKAQGQGEQAEEAPADVVVKALRKADVRKINMVSLADLMDATGLSRPDFLGAIRSARLAGLVSLDSHEGLLRPMTARVKAACIEEAGDRLAYASLAI